MRNKVVSAAEAVAIIRQGDMVATSGFVGVGTPEAVYLALEGRFLDTGQPRNLGLLFAAAPGDGKDKGLNRLAHEGLVRRAVGGHWSLVPKLGRMAAEGRIEASRSCSARSPGVGRASSAAWAWAPSSIPARRAASSTPSAPTTWSR